MSSVSCPICNQTASFKKELSKEFIIDELQKYWGDAPPKDAVPIDYSIYGCENCEYEFCNPSVEGSGLFYSWITAQKSYYTPTRWEYEVVINDINNRASKNCLDVGCGDGLFLNILKEKSPKTISLYGIDKTPDVALKTKQKGFDVFNYDVDSSLKSNLSTTFQSITLFHVLEHVSQPLNFVKNLLDVLDENGTIYISTPNSPMSFEKFWFDIMNHPPHHMSRFSKKSYLNIASLLNCSIKTSTSPSMGFLRSSYHIMGHLANTNSFNKKDVVKFFISNPLKSFKIILFSLTNKEKNTILVELRKNN